MQAGSLLVIVGAAAVVLGSGLAAAIRLANVWIVVTATVLWLVAFADVTGVAAQIYRGAPYLYAAEGIVRPPTRRRCSTGRGPSRAAEPDPPRRLTATVPRGYGRTWEVPMEFLAPGVVATVLVRAHPVQKSGTPAM